jgi:endonuclease I
MKNIYSLLLLISVTIGLAQDVAPASPYYNGFNWSQSGITLKSALATKITTTHTNLLSYSQVWSALKIVDLDPSNSGNVLLVYGWENGTDTDVTNDRTRGKDSNSGNNGDWNREHIFAQSLGDPDLGQLGPGADAQMLRACDVQRNSLRGNRLYAAGSGNSGIVGSFWYPGDEWKGDVARILMYMYLRYDVQCLPTFVCSGTTASSDINMPNLLLQWNSEDPVSQYEDNRNTYLGNALNTYSQGNRNPFIDNPYLATVIWGGPIAQNRWPNIFLDNQSFEYTNISVYPNPSMDHKINIESTVAIDDLQVINLNGQLLMEVKNPQFNNNHYILENIPNGFYFLKLNSNNQSFTKKVILN